MATGRATESAALSHDDYVRLATWTQMLAVSQRTEAGRAEFKRRKETRRRWLVYAHTQRFGCAPTACDKCKDSRATLRALEAIGDSRTPTNESVHDYTGHGAAMPAREPEAEERAERATP